MKKQIRLFISKSDAIAVLRQFYNDNTTIASEPTVAKKGCKGNKALKDRAKAAVKRDINHAKREDRQLKAIMEAQSKLEAGVPVVNDTMQATKAPIPAHSGALIPLSFNKKCEATLTQKADIAKASMSRLVHQC